MSKEIFFTSDTHFGHKNIIQYADRPFASVAEMDEELIRRWNSKVGPSDLVYHLGDFAFASSGRVAEIFGELNGRKHLVLGNHDYRRPQWIFELFDSFDHLKEIKVGSTRVVMCHFPLHSWHKSGAGSIHLHGHTHGTLPARWNRMDVGVDAPGGDYAPRHWDEVLTTLTAIRTEKEDLKGE